jgi:hypothetical protein
MQTCVTIVRAGALVGGLLVLGPIRAPMSVDPRHRPPAPDGDLISCRRALPSPLYLGHSCPAGTTDHHRRRAQLGHLDDVLIDPTEGQITMAIVAAGGRFGLGGRFMALPWPMLRPAADGTALVIALGPVPPQHPPSQEAPEDVPPR